MVLCVLIVCSVYCDWLFTWVTWFVVSWFGFGFEVGFVILLVSVSYAVARVDFWFMCFVFVWLVMFAFVSTADVICGFDVVSGDCGLLRVFAV